MHTLMIVKVVHGPMFAGVYKGMDEQAISLAGVVELFLNPDDSLGMTPVPFGYSIFSPSLKDSVSYINKTMILYSTELDMNDADYDFTKQYKEVWASA